VLNVEGDERRQKWAEKVDGTPLALSPQASTGYLEKWGGNSLSGAPRTKRGALTGTALKIRHGWKVLFAVPTLGG